MPLNQHERLTKILASLADGEQLTFREISEQTGISHYSMYRDVEELLAAGLIGSTGKIYNNATDRIVTTYVVTTKGRRFLEIMLEAKQLLTTPAQ